MEVRDEEDIRMTDHRISPTVFITNDLMVQWLIDNDIPKTIRGEGSHPEILKRAAPVLKFLSANGSMTQDMINLLWKCQLGKHEED